jgi:hypothetical protein
LSSILRWPFCFISVLVVYNLIILC